MKTIKNENKLNLSFDISKLSKRQRMTLDAFLADKDYPNVLRYLKSFHGAFSRIYLNRESKHVEQKGVREKPGFFSDLSKRLKNYEGASPNPKNIPFIREGFAMGVEIECIIHYEGSRYDLFKLLKEAFERKNIINVKIKDDGSIRTDDENEHSFEFVALFDYAKIDRLKDLCDVLSEFDAKVNKSCGLHVHLDARTGDGLKMKNRLKSALPFLNQLVPASRLSNQYCSRDVSNRSTRYAKINTQSLKKHGSVEVRMHSGTTDFNKIKNWCTLLWLIAKNPKRVKSTVFYSVGTALSALNIDADLSAWVTARVAKFKKQDHETFDGQTHAA